MRHIPLVAVEEAASAVYAAAVRTPLVRLDLPFPVDATPRAEVYLKLECLQPIGSFKLRGAYNAVRSLGREALAGGVWTVSAGNAAQGLAFAARLIGVPCSVMVMDTAPETKVRAIERLGASIVRASYDECWRTVETHRSDRMQGYFVHPFDDDTFIAGNATAGLEILEDLPDVDAVVAAIGGAAPHHPDAPESGSSVRLIDLDASSRRAPGSRSRSVGQPALDDVADRDDASQTAAVVDDGEVADAAVRHQRHQACRRRRWPSRSRRRPTSARLDRTSERTRTVGGDAAHEVALGDDALDRSRVARDDECPDAVVTQELGGSASDVACVTVAIRRSLQRQDRLDVFIGAPFRAVPRGNCIRDRTGMTRGGRAFAEG